MKKILLFISGLCLMGCSHFSFAKVKDFFTDPNTKRQQLISAEAETTIHEEIAKAYGGEYGGFLVSLEEPMPSLEVVSANIEGQLQKHTNINLSQLQSSSKTSMLKQAVIYNELSVAERALITARENLLKGVCSPKAFNSWDIYQISKGRSSSAEWFCNENIEYQRLNKQLENIQNLKRELYQTAYNEEREKFVKITGVDISNKALLTATLLNYMPLTPNKNTLYDLQNTRVIQTLPKGILVGGSGVVSDFGIYTDKMAFIYTSKDFVDGEPLQGEVKFVGTYQYRSVLGANRKVNAYRFFFFYWEQYNIRREDFYFYPVVRELGKSDIQKLLNI